MQETAGSSGRGQAWREGREGGREGDRRGEPDIKRGEEGLGDTHGEKRKEDRHRGTEEDEVHA